MTFEELVALIRGLADHSIAPDQVDWTIISEEDTNRIWQALHWALECQQERKRTRGRGQRRARRLLNSILTPAQLGQLRRSRRFFTVGTLGGHYRLWPNMGTAERVQKHGKLWVAHTSFCLHDDPQIMPPADVTIGHLMMLRSNEAQFLELANHTDCLTQLWNGEYLRRFRRVRHEFGDEEAERHRGEDNAWIDHEPWAEPTWCSECSHLRWNGPETSPVPGCALGHGVTFRVPENYQDDFGPLPVAEQCPDREISIEQESAA